MPTFKFKRIKCKTDGRTLYCYRK